MLLRAELRMLLRAPWRTALLCVLLAAAVGAASLGGGLLAASRRGMAELAEKYTTVAVLNSVYYDRISFASLKKTLENMSMAHLDKREIYGGYIKKIHTMTSLEEARTLRERYRNGDVSWEEFGNEVFFDEAYKKVMVVATCVDRKLQSLQIDSKVNMQEVAGQLPASFTVYTLHVEQVLSAHRDYVVPDTLLCQDNLSGNLFQVGKRYVVQGEIGLNVEAGRDQAKLNVKKETYHNNETGSVEKEVWPIFELRSTLEGELAGENGSEITRRLHECEIGNHSVDVISTECVNSILQFNQNDLYLTEGRHFTEEEHATAAQACLMSERLALKNGFSVGDTISMDLYHAAVMTYDLNWARIPFAAYWENKLLGESEYEIVGLFKTPEWDMTYTKMVLSPNTVIIPADNMNDTIGYLPKAMYSILIDNGHAEEFLAEMEELEPGSSEYFVIYDQGYSEVAPTIEAFAKNARYVAMGCAAVFVLAAGVFLAFAAAKNRHDLGVMRSLGATKARTERAFLLRCGMPAVAGGVLGALAGQVLFGRAVAVLGAEELISRPAGTLWVIAAGCTAAVICLTALAGAVLVNKKPQALMREKE